MIFDLEKDDLLEIVKNADDDELNDLAEEIRKFLIQKVSITGGHLASNLGVVELTIALHRIYNSPEDKIIFDVGHQSYVHKILTGRADKFDTLRQHGGLSGFPKSCESEHDAYETGHSSQSLSAAAGMAAARDLAGDDYNVVAVIGDGSMTGGLVYEALNNIGASKSKIRIVLNDNAMSISRNVGGISKHLLRLRTMSGYINAKDSVKSILDHVPVVGHPMAESIGRSKDRLKYSVMLEQGILFEELGIKYIGPVDGHDIRDLTKAFEAANNIDGPTLVHVITRKGKGYKWAERYPRRFHGTGPFDIETGQPLKKQSTPTFSKVFGEEASRLATENDKIVAITAAMGSATGLGTFCREHPERYFDVGIAEQHAVIFAAGMAKQGYIPLVAIYSSFLQRAFDQIIEDVALQGLHVIFAIDRAGLVGADGETHQGMFDLSYLSCIPGMKILTPADGNQLREMLDYAVNSCSGPVAIRYPKGSAEGKHLRMKPFNGSNVVLSSGSDVTILAVGGMLDTAIKVKEILGKDYSVGIIDVCVVKPYTGDVSNINSKLAVTIEDNVFNGGFGEAFAACSRDSSFDIMTMTLPDKFIPQGTIDELHRDCGLNPESVADRIRERLENGDR